MLIRHAAMQSNQKLYVDDVFSAYLYTGAGTSQTITNGIDLAGSGGLVWTKNRAGTTGNAIQDSIRQDVYTATLISNTTAPGQNYGLLLSPTNSGYNISNANGTFNNPAGTSFVSWTFRKAPKFFSLSTVTKSSGSDATVSFPDLATLGMVIVKRTDSTGSWYVWHRSLTAGKLLYLEQTAAEATLGHITVSGITVTLEDGVIADGTYIIYAYAHDTTEDGLIQCGSFTTDVSGNATVELGWEPQFNLLKSTDLVATWYMIDDKRGYPVTTAATKILAPNSSNAETTGTFGNPTATGFTVANGGATKTYIYLAIRRPNKPPTSGSEVYNAIARTGTGAAATVTGVGFAPDLIWGMARDTIQESGRFDRLRGANIGLRFNTDPETTGTNLVTSFDMDGVSVGASSSSPYINNLSYNFINYFLRRAKGFFDIVCYTGTGAARTVNHNLVVVPELMIVKCRSNSNDWAIYYGDNTDYLLLNSTAATADDATYWNDTTPTSTVFTVGTNTDVNQSTYTYVAYLFASLSGISKIGSYTGNGSTQNIDMGFSAGCRFFLVKRTDSTGDWFVWDSTRGIVEASDPHLSLNTTAAEVTTDDSVDPYAAGISIIQNTATNINVDTATYIYMGIS